MKPENQVDDFVEQKSPSSCSGETSANQFVPVGQNDVTVSTRKDAGLSSNVLQKNSPHPELETISH